MLKLMKKCLWLLKIHMCKTSNSGSYALAKKPSMTDLPGKTEDNAAGLEIMRFVLAGDQSLMCVHDMLPE